MSIPKHYELYKEVLQVLENGDTVSNKELPNAVAKRIGISDANRAVKYSSGNGYVFNDRVIWARTYLKAAGLLEIPSRGFSKITEEGKKVLAENLITLDNAYLSKYESFRQFYKGRTTNTETNSTLSSNEATDETPEERINSAFSQINSALREDILVEIMNQDPAFFERLVVKLLEKMGYGGLLEGAGTVTTFTNDGGIDGIIREDKLGFSNIYIQAKRFARDKTIDRPKIQTFVGAIANKAGKGLFVTTATFTEGAKQCAKENHIVLIDGDKLADLMIEHNVGVSTLRAYEVKRLDSDFFAE